MSSFWAEIRRRKVFQVAATYAIVAWLLVQVESVVDQPLKLPDWFDTAVIVLLAIGFPAAIVLAWAFDLTSKGIERTAPIVSKDSVGQPGQRAATAEPPTTFDPLSLAVLPFVNMSADSEQEYFSDGLSEELLHVLSLIPELRVAGRTSSFSFKGQNEDLRLIGQQLGVANILEGSVRKSGERLRITAQLINARDGYHLWSETFDRKLDDVFAIQDEIARAVSEALSVKLGVREATLAKELTPNIELYDRYLRARALYNSLQPVDLLRAADIYREIIATDPGFVRARAGLAEAFHWMMVYVPERNAETLPELEAAVAYGLTHAPDEWSTHFAKAVLHLMRHEWSDAEHACARAARDAPASDVAISELQAWMLQTLGRCKESVELLRATMSLDPLSIAHSWLLQQGLNASGQAEECEIEYQRSLELVGQREAPEHLALMRIWSNGDTERIRERFDRFLRHEVVPIPTLAAIRDVFEDRDSALALLRAGVSDPANQDATRQFLFALYAGHYCDTELALSALRRSLLQPGSCWVVTIFWYPDLAATRRTPGFKQILRELGLDRYWRESGRWGDFCRPLGESDFQCF